MNNEDWQEQARRQREDRKERREERLLERADDWQDERKKDKRRLAFTILTIVVVTVLLTTPMKIVDWSNCNDACEANGDETFWRISMGCFCDDGKGLYNPKDER